MVREHFVAEPSSWTCCRLVSNDHAGSCCPVHGSAAPSGFAAPSGNGGVIAAAQVEQQQRRMCDPWVALIAAAARGDAVWPVPGSAVVARRVCGQLD